MGLMKQFSMEQTAELAAKLGIEEKLFYTDYYLSNMAWDYARYMLSNKEVPDKEDTTGLSYIKEFNRLLPKPKAK